MAEGTTLASLPVEQLEEVVLLGNVGLTTPVIRELLRSGKDCVFCTQTGEYRGRLVSVESRHGLLRRRQLELALDPGRSLALSKALVVAKLHNQRTLVLRWSRSRAPTVTTAAETVERAINRAREAKDLGALRAAEGFASYNYFQAFGAALRGWQFSGRSRRPPRDPVNSLLSLGYTILVRHVESAVRRVGLDPYIGVYHVTEYSRPSLALDLAEEFRHLLVDSTVLRSLNVGTLAAEDFTQDPESGAVLLKKESLPIFVSALEQRLAQEMKHPWANERVTYERSLELQAREFARVALGERESYRGFKAR